MCVFVVRVCARACVRACVYMSDVSSVFYFIHSYTQFLSCIDIPLQCTQTINNGAIDIMEHLVDVQQH